MLSPSCLVWKWLNPGIYFSFSMLGFSLCCGNLESPFALVIVTELHRFFFFLSIWLWVLKISEMLFLLLYMYIYIKEKNCCFPHPSLMSSVFFEKIRWTFFLGGYWISFAIGCYVRHWGGRKRSSFLKNGAFLIVWLEWRTGLSLWCRLNYFLWLDIVPFQNTVVFHGWKVVEIVKSNLCLTNYVGYYNLACQNSLLTSK